MCSDNLYLASHTDIPSNDRFVGRLTKQIDTTPLSTPDTTHCQLSLTESFNYFCVKDAEWVRKRNILLDQSAQVQLSTDAGCAEYFQANFEPSFSCNFERRVGAIGDGGKWVCDPHRVLELVELEQRACVVLSIGSNNDFSFEADIHQALKGRCQIHTFDHTVAVPTPPTYVTYHSLGVARQSSGQLATLRQIISMVTEKGERVELLKIDVEGCRLLSRSA